MEKLGDQVGAALDASGIDEKTEAAAIFIAVEREGEAKYVAYDIRGEGLPLAEAAGSLVFNPEIPPLIAQAAHKALALRTKQEAAERDNQVNNPTKQIEQ